jgi:hypothetical protein
MNDEQARDKVLANMLKTKPKPHGEKDRAVDKKDGDKEKLHDKGRLTR